MIVKRCTTGQKRKRGMAISPILFQYHLPGDPVTIPMNSLTENDVRDKLSACDFNNYVVRSTMETSIDSIAYKYNCTSFATSDSVVPALSNHLEQTSMKNNFKSGFKNPGRLSSAHQGRRVVINPHSRRPVLESLIEKQANDKEDHTNGQSQSSSLVKQSQHERLYNNRNLVQSPVLKRYTTTERRVAFQRPLMNLEKEHLFEKIFNVEGTKNDRLNEVDNDYPLFGINRILLEERPCNIPSRPSTVCGCYSSLYQYINVNKDLNSENYERIMKLSQLSRTANDKGCSKSYGTHSGSRSIRPRSATVSSSMPSNPRTRPRSAISSPSKPPRPRSAVLSSSMLPSSRSRPHSAIVTSSSNSNNPTESIAISDKDKLDLPVPPLSRLSTGIGKSEPIILRRRAIETEKAHIPITSKVVNLSDWSTCVTHWLDLAVIPRSKSSKPRCAPVKRRQCAPYTSHTCDDELVGGIIGKTTNFVTRPYSKHASV